MRIIRIISTFTVKFCDFNETKTSKQKQNIKPKNSFFSTHLQEVRDICGFQTKSEPTQKGSNDKWLYEQSQKKFQIVKIFSSFVSEDFVQSSAVKPNFVC